MWLVYREAVEDANENTHWVGLAGQGAQPCNCRRSQASVLERMMMVMMGRGLGGWKAAASRSSLGRALQHHLPHHLPHHQLS
jgi:hypothetical protein